MRLYEIDIESRWWMAADDEIEAINLFKEELYSREFSDEEIDEAIDDLLIDELSQEEAECVLFQESFEDIPHSLWDLFEGLEEPGLVCTDFFDDPELN